MHCSRKIAEEIALTVKQHPYYLQRLAREIYDLGREVISERCISETLEVIIDMERYAFEAILSRLTLSQVRVIRTLAASPTQEMLSGDFVGRCGLPPSSVQFARDKLKTEDLIWQEKKSRTWHVVDPVFALWLKRL